MEAARRPVDFSRNQITLSGPTTLAINPTAMLTADLAGIDRNALLADISRGDRGLHRDRRPVDQHRHFMTDVTLLNAPGFSSSEFSFQLVSGDVVLRFAPVAEPVGILAVAALGACLTFRRSRFR